MTDMKHMDFIDRVAAQDVATLRRKEATYRGSWKAAGGRSAWFMLRRKIDRLMNMMEDIPWPESTGIGDLDEIVKTKDETNTLTPELAEFLTSKLRAEDIFEKIHEDASGGDGSVLAEIRDLRCYLVLVEAEMMARGVVEAPSELSEIKEKKPDMVITHGPVAQTLSVQQTMNAPYGSQTDARMSSTEPWIVTADAELIARLPEQCYTTRRKDMVYLEPAISRTIEDIISLEASQPSTSLLKDHARAVGIIKKILGCYTRVTHHVLVLDIKHAPKAWRELWPTLNREYNAKELSELPEWQKLLYEWYEAGTKFVIRREHTSWTE